MINSLGEISPCFGGGSGLKPDTTEAQDATLRHLPLLRWGERIETGLERLHDQGNAITSPPASVGGAD